MSASVGEEKSEYNGACCLRTGEDRGADAPALSRATWLMTAEMLRNPASDVQLTWRGRPLVANWDAARLRMETSDRRGYAEIRVT